MDIPIEAMGLTALPLITTVKAMWRQFQEKKEKEKEQAKLKNTLEHLESFTERLEDALEDGVITPAEARRLIKDARKILKKNGF